MSKCRKIPTQCNIHPTSYSLQHTTYDDDYGHGYDHAKRDSIDVIMGERMYLIGLIACDELTTQLSSFTPLIGLN